MRGVRSRTITPDEVIAPYPYRRVWRSLAIETGGLAAITAVALVVFGALGVALPPPAESALRVSLALSPLVLWLVFSVWAERRAPQPRSGLIVVAVITALAANAVTVPLIEQVLQPQAWLLNTSAITRIIGYTLTVGIATEFTKYLAIRYSVWPGRFETRMDGIAYAIATSIGFAMVWNLRLALGPEVKLDTLAISLFDTTTTGIAAGLIIGYGLSEMALARPSPFIGPLSLSLAAFVHGLSIPLRTGLINATFSLDGGQARPILGIGVSLAAVVLVAFLISFLFTAAERREREVAAGEA